MAAIFQEELAEQRSKKAAYIPIVETKGFTPFSDNRVLNERKRNTMDALDRLSQKMDYEKTRKKRK